MAERRSDFTQGTMARNILRISGPMMLALLINVLYSVVDRMYIGHMAGNGRLALTGIGLAFPIIAIVSAFQSLCSTGGAPLCSIARGEGDEARAQRIQGNAYCMLLIMGVVLTVLGLIFKKPLLEFAGANEETFGYANDYLTIYLFGTVFVLTGVGMNPFINAQGFAKTGMLTVLLGAVVNIVLDPVFIFVFDMGVKGAALATIIAQGCSALWVLLFLRGKKAILKLRAADLKLDFKIVRSSLALGVTGFTMALTNSAVGLVYNATLESLGGTIYVSVMTVINSLREILNMPVQGISSGSQPVIGYNYGARRYDRCLQGIKVVTVMSMVSSFVAWALVQLLPGTLIRIFNDDPELLEVGTSLVRTYFALFFMMAFQMAGQCSFVAMNKAKQAVFFSIFRKVILVIPLVLLLPRIGNLGVRGVFLSEPISDVIGGIACYGTLLLTVVPALKGKRDKT